MSQANQTSFTTENQPAKREKPNLKKLTTKQRVAYLESQLARERELERKEDDGQKYVVGGMYLALARTSPEVAARLLADLKKHVTRDADKKRIAPLLAELNEAQPKAKETPAAAPAPVVEEETPEEIPAAPATATPKAEGGA